MIKDFIVEEVRTIRKQIEAEQNNDWELLERYLLNNQKRHKEKLYQGKPNFLPNRDVA